MDSRLGNMLKMPPIWNWERLTDTIWIAWSWFWSGAAALCSDVLYSKGPRKHTPWLCRLDIWVKITMSVIGLALTCTGIWAAVSSVIEAKTANELAQWTSTKDFVEFCESHNFNASNCMSARNKTLPPPPGFSLLRWRSLSVSLWGSNSTPEESQHYSLDITSILCFVIGAIFLVIVIGTALRRISFGPSHHSSNLPLARSSNELTENNDRIVQEVGPRHRKSTGRRRREARQDRISRYRTIESNHTVDDDTSSDELYTHGEDTRRSRLRLRRRAKRVVTDENV
ncbi:protein phosphatase regulator [Podospora pseudocomata]|uniref:Protein phosphatase regulator n=1 Tax=Podospora pseudocomata TaxID=2093779 RepID=A0ABR0GQT0_9PEZI|nr:protein phosphatase regulator [Podospora pseudocomata]